MAPRGLAVPLGCALLVGFAPAAPVPTHLMKPSCYFPTQPGTEWVYAEDGAEYTRVLSRAERTGAKSTMTLLRERGYEVGNPAEVVVVTANGMFLASHFDIFLDPPLCLLQSPHRADQRWDTKYTRRYGDTFYKYQSTRTVGEPEWVEVPAGRYWAVPVVEERIREGEKQPTETYWYAPGVGEVKWVSGNRLRVLKSFTSGKE